MDKGIILVGGFHEIIELCEDAGYSIVGIIDNNLKDNYMGYPIIGNDSDAQQLFKIYSNTSLVITPDSPSLREKLTLLYSAVGFQFETLISPFARISRYAKIGKGTVIQSGVNISANSHIGNFVKLNTDCNIMHDSIIENFTTIAPNAVVLGRVIIREKTYIGANATILPERIIGNSAVVGAGAVVTKDIEDKKTVKGIPAK